MLGKYIKPALQGILLPLLLLMPARASGEELLPSKLQALFLKKIFVYNRTLAAKTKVQVLVLDEGDPSRDIVKTLTQVGVSAVLGKTVQDVSDNISVVYLTQPTPGIKEICAKKQVLTVSGSSKLAEKGEVSVAVGKQASGQPEIVVNVARAKVEGQDLGADLLGLARVIR